MFTNQQIGFREKSLEQLNSPERLDELITVTSPGLWAGVAGLLLLSAVVIGWAVFSRVPVLVQGEGILLSRTGLFRLAAPEQGSVRDLTVRLGDTVAAGQTVATVERGSEETETGLVESALNRLRERSRVAVSPEEMARLETERRRLGGQLDAIRAGSPARSQIRSPKAGRVIEVVAGNGSSVAAGAPILTLAPEGEELRATLFVPYSAGKRVRPGMKVRLTLASARVRQSGYLSGTVEEVSEFPASPEAMFNLLQNQRLVDRFSRRDGAPLMVSARLDADPASPGKYRWSFQGAAPEVRPGTLCEADFVLRQVRPYELLFRSAGATQGP